MAKSEGRGSNALEGKQGWQTVPLKPAVAPTANHNAMNLSNKSNSEGKISPTESGTSSSQDLTKIYDNYKKKIQRVGRVPRLSEAEYFDALVASNVSEVTARKAAKVLSTNPPILIATSGKQGSGKDSITDKVLEKLGAKEYYHIMLSGVLKDETQEVLADIRSSNTREEAIDKVVRRNVERHEAEQVVAYAYEGAKSEPNVTTRDRTNWVRSMLQYWGLEVRRIQDEDYWLKKGIVLAADAIAEGRNIIITDIRFPNEVDRLQTIGFTAARLDITPETQSKRLQSRDGLTVDPATLVHPSETALDEYKGFNIRVSNDDVTMDEVVTNIIDIFNK